jgi:hypothetical protein
MFSMTLHNFFFSFCYLIFFYIYLDQLLTLHTILKKYYFNTFLNKKKTFTNHNHSCLSNTRWRAEIKNTKGVPNADAWLKMVGDHNQTPRQKWKGILRNYNSNSFTNMLPDKTYTSFLSTTPRTCMLAPTPQVNWS